MVAYEDIKGGLGEEEDIATGGDDNAAAAAADDDDEEDTYEELVEEDEGTRRSISIPINSRQVKENVKRDKSRRGETVHANKKY